MAFFSKSKKQEAKKQEKVVKTKAVAAVAAPVVGGNFSNADVIIRPRITEKSGILSQANKYTFEVRKSANKQSVSRAISSLYKVSPVKVAIVNLPAKKIMVRGKQGTVSAVRKAVVTLKKGDKIDFV